MDKFTFILMFTALIAITAIQIVSWTLGHNGQITSIVSLVFGAIMGLIGGGAVAPYLKTKNK
jgi:hypothetical protein